MILGTLMCPRTLQAFNSPARHVAEGTTPMAVINVYSKIMALLQIRTNKKLTTNLTMMMHMILPNIVVSNEEHLLTSAVEGEVEVEASLNVGYLLNTTTIFIILEALMKIKHPTTTGSNSRTISKIIRMRTKNHKSLMFCKIYLD